MRLIIPSHFPHIQTQGMYCTCIAEGATVIRCGTHRCPGECVQGVVLPRGGTRSSSMSCQVHGPQRVAPKGRHGMQQHGRVWWQSMCVIQLCAVMHMVCVGDGGGGGGDVHACLGGGSYSDQCCMRVGHLQTTGICRCRCTCRARTQLLKTQVTDYHFLCFVWLVACMHVC